MAVSFSRDEGCSESDWLRLNLDLWRLTGETRYLDLAERLVENQYVANQCPNGGYGVAHFEGDSAGPVAIIGETDECPYCCSFHAPLGLHFLKGYLAAGCQRGVIVNFPYNFTAADQGSRAGMVGYCPQQARALARPHEHGDRADAATSGRGPWHAPGADAGLGLRGQGRRRIGRAGGGTDRGGLSADRTRLQGWRKLRSSSAVSSRLKAEGSRRHRSRLDSFISKTWPCLPARSSFSPCR